MRDHASDGKSTGDRQTAPSACPGCGSPNVTTTSKSVTAQTYWRCVTCGEVWNVARREPRRRRYGY